VYRQFAPSVIYQQYLVLCAAPQTCCGIIPYYNHTVGSGAGNQQEEMQKKTKLRRETFFSQKML
jgi:hypothetical protein